MAKNKTVHITFEQKLLTKIFKCNVGELNRIKVFLGKYREKYKEDLFDKFITNLTHVQHTFFYYEGIINRIWFYLLSYVIEKHIRPYGIKYNYEELHYIQKYFTDPEFRLKISNFRDLELELMRYNLRNGILNRMVNELNWFLEM
ncbi:MAG: hypothetical protein ACFFAO_19640 [Candidatus Hermodarchaeota archaeon]